MKVILSTDAIKYPLTGIGRYTFELANELAKCDQIEQLFYLKGTRLSNAVPVPAYSPGATGWFRRLLLQSRIAVESYRAIVPRLKARALRGLEDHLFHGPNFYLPPFGGHSVVTIHDLSIYRWQACHPQERVRYMKAEIELSLKRAAMLITDSEFTRKEAAEFFGWPLERVRAVSLACAKDFHPQTRKSMEPLLGQYGLSAGGYCLFAGTIEPRKNIDTLLDAYSMLPATVRRRWPLVLIGYQGWSSADVHARISEAARAGWARYLGFVPAEHLPILYAGARLFVYPSLYEGFGLPVLEAMASGVPVVCSNASSLPEVVGDAGAMCDALDVDTLWRLISKGLDDEQWRRVAAQKGLSRAENFSWKRCAQETVAAYQAALRV